LHPKASMHSGLLVTACLLVFCMLTISAVCLLFVAMCERVIGMRRTLNLVSSLVVGEMGWHHAVAAVRFRKNLGCRSQLGRLWLAW